VIVLVCENECVAFNTPTPSANVFRPVIKLPHAPAAVGMKNNDVCGTDLAAVNPTTDDELSVVALRDCRNGGETDKRGTSPCSIEVMPIQKAKFLQNEPANAAYQHIPDEYTREPEAPAAQLSPDAIPRLSISFSNLF
jgi:hypothetical protein